MEIKVDGKKIEMNDIAELLEDVMAHAESVSSTYDAKSDFSQGMAQAYSEMLNMIGNWSKSKKLSLNINLEDWAVKHLS